MKRASLTVVSILLILLPVVAQIPREKRVAVKGGMQIVLRDTSFTTKNDTIIVVTEDEERALKIRNDPFQESTVFYDSLKRRASTRSITKRLFDFVIRKKKHKEKLVNVVVKAEDAFLPYQGYTIHSIVFKHVDLLEGSVIDTLQKATTGFGKFVNRIHTDTRARIVRQNLLFKVGDTIDPYVLADNERTLRQFKTLRDVRIYVRKNNAQTKLADIIVVTQDVTAFGASGAFRSFKNFQLDVYNINIMGYARQLRVSYFRRASDTPSNGYEVTLREPNFFGSFMQGELQYTNNYLRTRARLVLGRDFFTPEIKYAGGVDLYRTRENFYFEEYDTLALAYTDNSTDVWAGRSIQFRKRKNLIFSVRVNTHTFTDQPFVSRDSNSFFYNRALILGSVVLTKRNYLKSLRIRGFGRTEDIPTGGSVNLIAGKEINQFKDRVYLELDANWGRYISQLGYLNLSMALGSFFKGGIHEDGLVRFSGTYFSDLVKVRKAHVRHFIYTTYTKGFHRILDRTIGLPGRWRDGDLFSPLGNQRLTLSPETVYFMPWYIYGFQFALYHRFDINFLSNGSALFTKQTLFPMMRLGVRMLNENLVLPTFSVEVIYYGNNPLFGSGWQFKFTTTLANLFGTAQAFKPQVSAFD